MWEVGGLGRTAVGDLGAQGGLPPLPAPEDLPQASAAPQGLCRELQPKPRGSTRAQVLTAGRGQGTPGTGG